MSIEVLARVLVPTPALNDPTPASFWRALIDHAHMFERPVDRAIVGGALADRLGFAFLAGYASALHALDPTLDPRTVACLAATEEGGAHPKAIRTRLERDGEGWRLTGRKQWVTLAGSTVLVLATRGSVAGERADLVVVRVTTDGPGVRVTPLPALPF